MVHPTRLQRLLHATTTATTASPFKKQPPRLIVDTLSPTPSHLLNLSLSEQLPATYFPAYFNRDRADAIKPPAPAAAVAMPLGHHLVYFAPQKTPRSLMPDGAELEHFPGGPLTRRVWAGGRVEFADGWDSERDGYRLDGRVASCVETVGAPVARGASQVLVEVTRRYFFGDVDGRVGEIVAETEGAPRPLITETRTLAFLGDETRVGGKKLLRRAPSDPVLRTSITPDRALLFHFSALTLNAHAIHLDRDYAVRQEHHRDLLVHGPLTLLLMLSALRANPAVRRVRRLDYRNLAPLYVDEPLEVLQFRHGAQGKRPDETSPGASTTSGSWKVQIQSPDGGLAVMGTAETVDACPRESFLYRA